jgi:hypothetical protein
MKVISISHAEKDRERETAKLLLLTFNQIKNEKDSRHKFLERRKESLCFEEEDQLIQSKLLELISYSCHSFS